MEEAHARIQQDLLWGVWLAFSLALFIHGYARRRFPMARWHEHGNVPTQAFTWVDLVVVLLFFLGVKVATILFLPKKPVIAPALTIDALLTGACFQVIVISFLLVLLMARKINVVDLLGLRRMSVPAVLIFGGVTSLIVIPLVMALGYMMTNLLARVLGELPQQSLVAAFRERGDLPFRLTTFIVVVFIAPVFEEVVFRGYLYGVTKRYSERFFAACFSSMVFALSHEGVISLAPIFALAMFLVIAYETFGCLWIPIVMHSCFNLANLLFLLASPA